MQLEIVRFGSSCLQKWNFKQLAAVGALTFGTLFCWFQFQITLKSIFPKNQYSYTDKNVFKNINWINNKILLFTNFEIIWITIKIPFFPFKRIFFFFKTIFQINSVHNFYIHAWEAYHPHFVMQLKCCSKCSTLATNSVVCIRIQIGGVKSNKKDKRTRPMHSGEY